MCGILGQFRLNVVLPPGNPDLSLLAHRGPDGQGIWQNTDQSVWLGHTRLAILDPTPAGKQPMTDASGRFVITFNGEIYNHLSLRRYAPDVVWRSTSDTETLIELFARLGLQVLSMLKGMFAFAVYDQQTNTLILARDRLGIKPLWVYADENVVRFSSEIRPLLSEDLLTLAKPALSEYIGFGRMPATSENFNGIVAVLPGSWQTIGPNGHRKLGIWWPGPEVSPKPTLNQQGAAEKVRSLLTKAVDEHLLSDVGVGTFLSGGVDSSILTVLAGRRLGKQLKTCTVGFSDSPFDERTIARKVAAQVGSEHHEIDITEIDCLSWVEEAVLALDIPSVDAINTYIVSKAVRQLGIKVALSGLGGDELFGGYPSFNNIPTLAVLGRMPIPVRDGLISLLPNSYREKLSGLSDYGVQSLTLNRRRFMAVTKLKRMGLMDGVSVTPPCPADLDQMSQVSWGELQGYMMPMLLRDSDQMSMAVGLELRVPFLDHELVEGVLRIPQRYKQGTGTKPLLVEAFRADLLPEVYNRPKQGFALPMDKWIRGPLHNFTRDGIQHSSEWLGLQEPLQNWQAFVAGKLHWTRIWGWVTLGHWVKQHNHEPVS